ncbi:MAG: alpha/beta hydrolase [Hyphomicrobium sp.]
MKTALIALAAIYLAAVAIMYFAQRAFLYFPDAERVAPEATGLATVREIWIPAPDGEKVVAWYGKAKPGQPTLLYFHGNGGSLAIRDVRIRRYLALGRGVFMMSYRGYSGSTGAPSETANVADAKRAYDALIAEGVTADKIVIYGESLGTGVAVQLAAEKPARGLILESPFTSIAERASQLYPWLPVNLLLKDRYDSRRYISNVRAPLLIVHGELDRIVPAAMGHQMFALANAPKEMALIAGAGHEDHYLHGSYERINDWIDRLMSRPVR